MKSRFAPAIAVLCALVCAFTGSLAWVVAERLAPHPGTDGVWCRYDAHGELVERQIDTNGDGRPDVAEYYGHGALLRRASDRNFNGVTDLVEDFDADTQEPVRSIVDQDYDGTADLFVLFRDGKPVVLERAAAARESTATVGTIGGSSAAGLVALRNPFAGAAAIDSPVSPTPHETWIRSEEHTSELQSRP